MQLQPKGSNFRISKDNPKLYRNDAEACAAGVPTSTRVNNSILSHMLSSRRIKALVTSDDQLTRRNAVKKRLREKLAAKQKLREDLKEKERSSPSAKKWLISNTMSDLENKCLKISKKIEKISQQELASRGLGTNKKINNIILSRMVASRRHKCRVVSDHHETRQDKIKKRLREKLAKQKKSS